MFLLSKCFGFSGGQNYSSIVYIFGYKAMKWTVMGGRGVKEKAVFPIARTPVLSTLKMS